MQRLVAKGLLAALALDELRQLARDHAERARHLVIGLACAAAPERQHTEDLGTRQHRHRVGPVAGRRFRLRLRNGCPALARELGDVHIELASGGDASELVVLSIHQPDRPALPGERLADDLHYPRRRLLGRLGLRCDSGDRVRGGQSLFRLLPRGDVEQIALREELPPVRVLDDQALVLNPDRPSVAGDQPVFGLERLRGLVAVRDEREDSIAIIRMEQLRKELWVAEPLVDRVAEQGLDLRTRVQRRSALRERVDVRDERKLLDQGPVLGFRREQLGLGTRPLKSREKLSVAPQSEHLQSISAAAGVQLIVRA